MLYPFTRRCTLYIIIFCCEHTGSYFVIQACIRPKRTLLFSFKKALVLAVFTVVSRCSLTGQQRNCGLHRRL